MAKLANLVWRITPHCREVARLTSEELDRPLPLGTQLRLNLHRRFCKWCARYAEQLQLLHQASHRLAVDPDQTGPALDRDAKARIKRALR
jgi:hypothetical protein